MIATHYRSIWPTIQHIYGFDDILSDILNILLHILVNKYEPNTSKYQCRAYKLLTIGREEKKQDCFSLNLFNFQI